MRMHTNRQEIIQFSIITGVVLLITMLHYFTRRGDIHLHVVYRELYFLPIILAGFWFGLRGGIATSLVIVLLYLPFIIVKPSGVSGHDFANILQVSVFAGAGVLIGWLRDRELAEQEKRRKSEALAAMGKAVSCIAHDMKTPLMAIGGFTRQVLRRMKPENSIVNKLTLVMEQVDRLERLVKDMLVFAKPLDLEFSKGDINALVRGIAVVAEEKASRHGVRLALELLEDSVLLDFDKFRLEQAVMNLITNAIEASPDGGEVMVRTAKEKEWFIIEILDQGCGIPEHEGKDIFNPFFTTKKEGTGLGLPIVKKILKAHDGRLNFRHRRDCGVAFRLMLPIAT